MAYGVTKEANAKYAKEWRKAHPDYLRNWRKCHQGYFTKHQRELVREVLTHYSNGKCACAQCGFSDIRALSIDHINNDGKQHRTNLLKDLGYSPNICQWLKTQGYPEGYQTLCMNCQFVKRP